MDEQLSKKGVDTHFHVFDAQVAVAGARYVPQYSARLSDWMAQAQRVGINRGVCVQPSFLGADNRLMLRALSAHPNLLRGIAVVTPDVTVQELRDLHQFGVCGIRLNLAGITHEIPKWTQADHIWHFIHLVGWHLELHTDQGQLPRVLNQLPSNVPVVIDHMAKPTQLRSDDPSLKALTQRAKHSAVNVKLSGAYRLGGLSAEQLARLLLNELGCDALLWGSDWPCTNHEKFADFEQLMQQAQTWLGCAHLQKVLHDNPIKLYWSHAD
jgi:predicted TIM-barrel fold metal-dependent hydrolase